ncbi:MAG: hypothetical protein OXU61_07055 [Gammaproteobacteria bacterium]|nr:hypothetical protein [Gammaproteobacteria bacterium]
MPLPRLARSPAESEGDGKNPSLPEQAPLRQSKGKDSCLAMEGRFLPPLMQ